MTIEAPKEETILLTETFIILETDGYKFSKKEKGLKKNEDAISEPCYIHYAHTQNKKIESILKDKNPMLHKNFGSGRGSISFFEGIYVINSCNTNSYYFLLVIRDSLLDRILYRSYINKLSSEQMRNLNLCVDSFIFCKIKKFLLSILRTHPFLLKIFKKLFCIKNPSDMFLQYCEMMQIDTNEGMKKVVDLLMIRKKIKQSTSSYLWEPNTDENYPKLNTEFSTEGFTNEGIRKTKYDESPPDGGIFHELNIAFSSTQDQNTEKQVLKN